MRTHRSRLCEVVHRETWKEFPDKIYIQVKDVSMTNLKGLVKTDHNSLFLEISPKFWNRHFSQQKRNQSRYNSSASTVPGSPHLQDDRYRMQMVPLPQALTYRTARLEALVESSCHHGTNEVLLYKVLFSLCVYWAGLIYMSQNCRFGLCFGMQRFY